MDDSRLVYSTESAKLCQSCQKPVSGCVCKKKKSKSQTNIKIDGIIRIQREVKGRKGKTVTIVSGFQLADDELKNLATKLKRKRFLNRSGYAPYFQAGDFRLSVFSLSC